MSVRQDIVDAVLAKFQTIATPTYHSDLGTNFSKWRSVPFSDDELPAGSLYDRLDEVDSVMLAGTLTRERRKLTIDVHLFAKANAPDDTVRAMIYDIQKAIGADDTFGVTGVSHSLPVSDDLYVVQNGTKVADAVVTFEIYYTKTLWGES